MTRAWFALATLLLCGVSAPGFARGLETPCARDTIGLDPSQAGNSAGAVLGDSPGQTFFAADTLILSLTVWRVPEEWNNGIGLRLYVTETDSTGRPDNFKVLQNGPTIVNRHGDGVNPTPFRWEFDPPLALPGPGTYAFFIAQDPCLVYFDLIGTSEGAGLYPDGCLWTSGRGCYLSGYPRPFCLADLIFQVEFCTDRITAIKTESWGTLKLIYR
jgi:hypothetical protein